MKSSVLTLLSCLTYNLLMAQFDAELTFAGDLDLLAPGRNEDNVQVASNAMFMAGSGHLNLLINQRRLFQGSGLNPIELKCAMGRNTYAFTGKYGLLNSGSFIHQGVDLEFGKKIGHQTTMGLGFGLLILSTKNQFREYGISAKLMLMHRMDDHFSFSVSGRIFSAIPGKSLRQNNMYALTLSGGLSYEFNEKIYLSIQAWNASEDLVSKKMLLSWHAAESTAFYYQVEFPSNAHTMQAMIQPFLRTHLMFGLTYHNTLGLSGSIGMQYAIQKK